MPRTPTPIPEELQERLAQLFEEHELREFLEVLEAVRAAGQGYGMVLITMSHQAISDIEGRFTRKPRIDQSGLLRSPESRPPGRNR